MSTNASASASTSEFLDQREAGKILGLSQASITKLIARGMLPSFEVPYAGKGRRTNATGAPLRKTRRAEVLEFDARFPVINEHRVYKARKPPAKRPRIFGPGDFLRLFEAAKLCGVHANTVRKWVANGTLPTEDVRSRHGSFPRLRRSTLEAFIAAGMPRPAIGRPKGSRNRPK
jgi:excisionase family DNA binding protein